MAEARARSWGGGSPVGFPAGASFQREGLFSLVTKVLGTEWQPPFYRCHVKPRAKDLWPLPRGGSQC